MEVLASLGTIALLLYFLWGIGSAVALIIYLILGVISSFTSAFREGYSGEKESE